jgi:ribosomal protein S11
MGKKRIVKGASSESSAKGKSVSKASKKKVAEGILYVEATFNNTKVSLTDKKRKCFVLVIFRLTWI